MRLRSLLCAASLALATPGCTLVGATTGAIVASSRDSKDVSVPAHVAVGAAAGLAVDVAIVVAAASSTANPFILVLLLLAAGA
jgi:hypothetical protein